MKAVIILTILACAMALAYGDLVCWVCGRNYCKYHPCTTPVSKESCKSGSTYRENHAGKCACCPACVTLLPENSACERYSKEIGETPSAICKEGLKCVGGVCIKDPRT